MTVSGGGAFATFFERLWSMNNSFRDWLGFYAADVHVAYARDKGLTGGLVAAGWCAFPFALQALLHPGDVIRWLYKLHGHHALHVLTAQLLGVGVTYALIALALLAAFQLVCTVLFYRRAQMNGETLATPPLWPLAAVLPGVLGNVAWFLGTGVFDVGGCVVGLSAAALTVGIEMVVANLSRDFVLGFSATNEHPPQPEFSSW